MVYATKLCALLLTAFAGSSTIVYADSSPPAHKCVAPLKQTQFATQFQLDSYRAAVDLYRSCLEAFVKEQEREITIHQRAAQGAIDEWNRFVGQETKGQPSAPQDKGGQPGGEFRQ